MALSKIQSESINLADTFAFTGTVSGAGSEGLVHLETQETTTAVASIKFGSDVFNTTYDRYYVVGRALPSTDADLYFRFLDSSETELTASSSYRWSLNSGANTNATYGRITSQIGAVHNIEHGVMWECNIWLPHVGLTDYDTLVTTTAARINGSNNIAYDDSAIMFRYDQDSTQPVGVVFYMSTGNFAKATISVFAVSGA